MMPDEDVTGGAAVIADEADFCTTCGNSITVEGKCAPCGQEPDACTCTGNEEGSHIHPHGGADAAM